MTALTITSGVLNNGAQRRQLYVTVQTPATPTQATNTIIYDPTTTPWTNGGPYVATKIRAIKTASSIQGTAGVPGAAYLTWDASTPVTAYSIPANNEANLEAALDELWIPLPNQGGSGVTGKIGLTTLGLVQGDTLTILLDLING